MTIDICVAAKRFPPQYGGAGKRFQRYAPGLQKRRVKMRVYTTTTASSSLVDLVDGIYVYRERISPVSSSHIIHAYSNGLLHYISDSVPDALHMLNLPTLSTLLKMHRLGIPMVFSVTMAPYTHKHRVRNTISLLRNYALKFYLLDAVVVSSRVLWESFQVAGFPKNRMVVIPNGVDLSRFKPRKNYVTESKLKAYLDIPLDAQVVLFVGAINARKGIHLLAEAWTLLAADRPNAMLVIVGPNPMRLQGLPQAVREERELFYKQIRKILYPFKEQVRFVDVVENIEDFYQIADLFAFPSQHEGMANVILEAFASGVPVVLTPHTGLTEEFGYPGKHYALAQPTAKSLAEEIKALLENTERRQLLAKNSLDLVTETMSLEGVLDQYANLYFSLVRR